MDWTESAIGSKGAAGLCPDQEWKEIRRVFDLNHRTTTFENGGWDDASDYIYRMLAEDR